VVAQDLAAAVIAVLDRPPASKRIHEEVLLLPASSAPRAISLFSGAGGLDYGMQAAGFSVVASTDIEEYACKTLRLNFPTTKVVGPPELSGDFRQWSPGSFLEAAELDHGQVSFVFGGPPCQPFSIAANQRFRKTDSKFKRLGFDDPERGDLVRGFIEFVRTVRPTCFLLENVPGLAELDGGKTLAGYLVDLQKAGYCCSPPILLNAVNFGVPQYRERLFVLGIHRAGTAVSLPQCAAGASRRVLAHALADMPHSMPNHVVRNHSPGSIARYRTLAFGQRERLGRVDRLDPRLPSKTVIAGGSNGGGRSHLHPYLARTLTVRECARLQTFPDTFQFEGSIARQFTQVGNAVPPLLAFVIGAYIMKEVFGLHASLSRQIAPYLGHEESVGKLCHRLWVQSLDDRPQWVYVDSQEANPAEGGLQTSLLEAE
jgi:DNA (cytosine-5)-methyltransferase 1